MPHPCPASRLQPLSRRAWLLAACALPLAVARADPTAAPAASAASAAPVAPAASAASAASPAAAPAAPPAASAAAGASAPVDAGTPLAEVWKGYGCECCDDWVTYLREQGFAVQVFTDNAGRYALGMPKRYASCHTARVAGYLVEGHVPASDIRRLLRERPDALGLAVPAMPVGAPGMDDPSYGPREPYDVLLVRKDGSSSVFASYR